MAFCNKQVHDGTNAVDIDLTSYFIIWIARRNYLRSKVDPIRSAYIGIDAKWIWHIKQLHDGDIRQVNFDHALICKETFAYDHLLRTQVLES